MSTYYDGDYSKPVQHGPIVPLVDNEKQTTLYSATFHQLATRFRRERWGAKGPSNSVLVEESTPEDTGVGGVVQWTRLFASVPPPRVEYLDHVYNLQQIAGGDILEVPLLVTAAVQYEYFHTTKPDRIRLFEPRRAVKIGSGIYLLGDRVLETAQWIVAEASSLRRWKGHIYERVTKLVRRRELVIQD